MYESDRRPCPYCAEPIAVAATKCRYCGEWLTDADQPALGVEVEDALSAQTYEGRGASQGRAGRVFKKEPWSLRPGERVVSRSQPYIRRLLILEIILGVILAIPTFGLALLLAPGTWLYYRFKRFEWVLTDRRLIMVGGWLARAAHSVSLDKVNEINYGRTFLERVLFSTGTVVVESAATAGVTALKSAADDDPFRHALETQVELRRRGVGMRPAPHAAQRITAD
jgi:Bacterial PH domain